MKNFYHRYHQDNFLPLADFSRFMIEKESERNLLGLKIDTAHFISGAKIIRFELFGYLIEWWTISRFSQSIFNTIEKQKIRRPFTLDILKDNFKKSPTKINRAKFMARLALYKIKTGLLKPFFQYTKIYENFGEHDIEGSLYIAKKNLFFVRSKYLIKLAMDLKLLKDRDNAKNKQNEIGRSINSFNIKLFDDENTHTGKGLETFNLIQHPEDFEFDDENDKDPSLLPHKENNQ